MSFFSIANPHQVHFHGGYTAKDADELATGILAKISASGVLDACDADDAPDGFAYSNRTLIYTPVSQYVGAGEPVTLANGDMEVLADAFYFVNGTLPTFGADIYAGAGGKMTTTGASTGFVGKCIGTDTIRAIPNTESNIVRLQIGIRKGQ